MKIAVLKEIAIAEKRVAASVETVKKLVAAGHTLVIEKNAGANAAILDAAYQAAGATIAPDASSAVADADIILKVQPPQEQEAWLEKVKPNAALIAIMAAYDNQALIENLASRKITTFAMDFMPRITRAQAMDVLSSQSNLAGYRAVLDAAYEFGRGFPMMMTAAGTVAPARVLVLGAGVAGLQAIATAKRLGAIVSAFDVRPAAKEQVQSLGATFVEVEAEEDAETKGGYAKEMSEDYKKRQQAKIAETLAKTDIAICTALIPGKPAPVLIPAEFVKAMKAGSIIVDLAAERGGNCALSELGKVVVKHDVKIVAHHNVPSRIAVDASALYAKNILNFLNLLTDKDTGSLVVKRDDEIIQGTLLTFEGAVVHPSLTTSKSAA